MAARYSSMSVAAVAARYSQKLSSTRRSRRAPDRPADQPLAPEALLSTVRLA